MDSNDIIKKLISLAEKRQKIINKLAQSMSAPAAPAPHGGATTGWDINKDQLQDLVDAIISRRDPKSVGKVDISGARLDKEHGQLTVGFVVDPTASALWEGISTPLAQILTTIDLKDKMGGNHKASTTNFNA